MKSMINTYFSHNFMISYDKQQHIELYISTWINDAGELFDFNTKDFHQINSFRACQFQIPIPKNKNSQHYYFLHQMISTTKEDKNKFILERRKTFQSNFDFQQYRVRNYKLIGCFKVFVKQVGQSMKRYVPYIQVKDIEDVKIKKGKDGEQKIQKQKAYMVVKSFNKGFPLKENQILKFGKAEYKVKEIALQPTTHEITQSQILYIPQIPVRQTNHKLDNICQNQPSDDGSTRVPACRICYDKENSPKNPLIAACKCKGQIANIHMECLKKWLDTKLKNSKNNQDQNSYVYNTKQLFCQICKQKLPKKIINGSNEYLLLNFMEGFSPFIALQNMNDMEVNPSDLIFVTFPDGEATSIGRLDDNGMILYENSVSRKHAKIYLHQEKNVFMLKDTDSKYGTLVYEKDPVFRLHSTIRAIEIGNTVFSFKII